MHTIIILGGYGNFFCTCAERTILYVESPYYHINFIYTTVIKCGLYKFTVTNLPTLIMDVLISIILDSIICIRRALCDDKKCPHSFLRSLCDLTSQAFPFFCAQLQHCKTWLIVLVAEFVTLKRSAICTLVNKRLLQFMQALAMLLYHAKCRWSPVGFITPFNSLVVCSDMYSLLPLPLSWWWRHLWWYYW